MGPFNGAILMRYAAVIATRRHAVVCTQGIITVGEIVASLTLEIMEGGGQAVGPMFAGRAPECPQRILQALGDGDEALTAEHHVGVAETGIRQPKVIQPVIERHAADRDCERPHVGEVGKSQTAGFRGPGGR